MTRKRYTSPVLRRFVRCGLCGHYHAAVSDSAPSDPATVCGSECLNPACPECEKLLQPADEDSAAWDVTRVGAWTIAGAVLGYALTGTPWGVGGGILVGFLVGCLALGMVK